jgi:hypothetical protein
MKTRLKSTWVCFLPVWLLPFYFWGFGLIVALLGRTLAVAGFFLLLLGGVSAIKAKPKFTWGEFYMLYAALPVAVLFVGFWIMVLVVRLRQM